MARIVGVTFETISHAQAGRFGIPRQVAALLGIGDDDPIEARVLWEGQQVELSARLASGLELYARAGDPTTEALASLPPKTPIMVTVWASEDARNADQGASRGRDTPWTDDEFRHAFEQRVGHHCPLDRLMQWAAQRGLTHHYGMGRTGPLYLDYGSVFLITLGSRGSAEIVMQGNLDSRAPFTGPAARRDLLREVVDRTGIQRDEHVADTWFGIGSDVLTHPARLEGLISVLEWLIAQLGPHGVIRSGGKYEALTDFLRSRDPRPQPTTFAEIEAVIGARLPPASRKYHSYWSGNTGGAARAIKRAGGRSSDLDMKREHLVFVPVGDR